MKPLIKIISFDHNQQNMAQLGQMLQQNTLAPTSIQVSTETQLFAHLKMSKSTYSLAAGGNPPDYLRTNL